MQPSSCIATQRRNELGDSSASLSISSRCYSRRWRSTFSSNASERARGPKRVDLGEKKESMEDVVVIGGGPAGLAAATWLGRYRRKTVLVGHGPARNLVTGAGHGYLGHDGEPPGELLAVGR